MCNFLALYLLLILSKIKLVFVNQWDCFGKDHPTCARTLNEMGNIHLQLGNIDDVMKCYSEALRIYKKAELNDDQLVIYGQSLWRFDVVQPKAAAMA